MPEVLFANSESAIKSESGERIPTALESEIRHIYKRSPLYQKRYPLNAEPLNWNLFKDIPLLSKREIVERGHYAFFNDHLEVERGLEQKN